MLNRIVIQGRIAQELTVRYTQSQKPVLSFTIACERDFSREDGKRPVDFIDVTAWNGTAEFINKYFQKGSMIAVDGRLQIRDWTDKEGNKRRSAEINVENAYFGESKRTSAQEAPQAPQLEELPDDDGDLPF